MHVFKFYSEYACVESLEVYIQWFKIMPKRVVGWEFNPMCAGYQEKFKSLSKRMEVWKFSLMRGGLKSLSKSIICLQFCICEEI